MEPQVITARSGATLRDYATSFQNTPGVLIFPESGLDANEQAAVLKTLSADIHTIITLSPWIISDAHRLQVLDDQSINLAFGSSVNKVSMQLWRGTTIAVRTAELIEQFSRTPPSDELVSKIYRELGDSVDRTLLLNSVVRQMQKVHSSKANQHH